MASDVMSLFGLNPNALQQQRTNDAVTQASAMNPFFAAGAAGGALMGQSVNSALGLQTPEMAQAEGVQQSLEGADLTTPEGMRDAASKLMQAGDYATAMDLYSRASSMVAAEPRPVAATKPSYANAKTYVLPSVGGKAGKEVWGLTVDGVLMIDTPEGRINAPSGTLPLVAESRPPASDSAVGTGASTVDVNQAYIIAGQAGENSKGISFSDMNTDNRDLMSIWIGQRADALNVGDDRVGAQEAMRIATAEAMEGMQVDPDSGLFGFFQDSIFKDPTGQATAPTSGTSINQNAMKYLPK